MEAQSIIMMVLIGSIAGWLAGLIMQNRDQRVMPLT
jgi:uncharacterized membrane protein YeaQ/YmgE (transglycosylase-associated protein family)